MTTIDLPATFTAEVVDELSKNGYWQPNCRHFIVLYFGRYEVARWEWQADYPLEERNEPDNEDIEVFIAEKASQLFKGLK